MTGSALDDFAAASRAIRRLVEHVGSANSDEVTPDLSRLRSEYPTVFADFPHPSASTRQQRLDALTVAGSRIAEALASGLTQYARARYRDDHYQDAVRVFGLALVIHPSSASAAVMHASALELSHPRADYLTPARHATVLAPLGPDGWRLAMRGSLAAGNFTAARDRARRHLILAPNSLEGWFSLARAGFRGGRPEDALSNLPRSRSLAPADLRIQLAWARCLFRLGRFDDALSAIEHAGKLGASGPDHVFEHARIARSAGRPDLATPLLDALTADDPSYINKREILELTATVDELRGGA